MGLTKNVDLLTLRSRYAYQPQPVETTYAPPETEIGGSSYSNPFLLKNNTGLSNIVANATQNDKGSYDIEQYIDSGYGRKGLTHETFIG